MDILILGPNYPVGLLSNKLYIAAGVLAAFECKRTLRREHIKKAVQTSVRLSRMIRSDKAVSHTIFYGLLAHSYQFSSTRKTPVSVVSEALFRADEKEVVDPRDSLDFICVPNLGAWSLRYYVAAKRRRDENNVFRDASQEDGVFFLSGYFGPLDHPKIDDGDAIGYFLVQLLQDVGKTDSSLRPIADYLGSTGVGLFRAFTGTMRAWGFDEIPDDLRLSLSGARHGFLIL